ncbi:Methylase involved in ubiquinone/menaquinone biosynthesis [Variovorax sp. HW608]|uniref:class I SAM-dependent methyltransferase n=1 Tax=Variovorax sp. HW608 TaxID=1034889 RepID=UPI00081FA5F7|nr:class I SAM-dependent methyltransferase [Variovorax sp. HW608]SCK11463.1 Methylase involved in ubiquinone/menaquinone biosynthesis [Variovorax sp. HW608]
MNSNDVANFWEANADAWTRLARLGVDVFRDMLNSPAFFGMLPPVAGLAGLDVGCGEGGNTRQLARLGARMAAVDIAPTFVRNARDAEAADPLGIDYRVGDGMALPFPARSFDFVTAFMSLMDMPDPVRALHEASRVLRPGGFLQFSILHPCFAAPHREVVRDANGRAQAIEVGGYFDSTEGRVDTWWFSTLKAEERAQVAPFRTPIFHRTLSQWFDIVLGAGLHIDKIGEPTAGPGSTHADDVVDDTRVAPLSLHIRATKGAVRRRKTSTRYSA